MAVTTVRAGLIAIEKLAVAFAELPSTTWTVKFAVPAVVGVPPMVPEALRVRPAGGAPAVRVHVYPPVPPAAARDCEYATPTTPPGSDDVLTLSPAVTAIDSCAVAFAELPSTTWTVKFAVPAVVGVPPMVPEALRVRPAGGAPAVMVHVYPPVPPAAASVCW